MKVIVATVKLGMGYDKGDIAFVIHYQMPQNIVSYYQQIGRAGRNIDRADIFLMYGKEDLDFTVRTVKKTLGRGYGVVSGGAKGVDTIAGAQAILDGGVSVEYLSDSLLNKLKKSEAVRNIQQGKLLMLSVAKPDAGFNVGMAMMRNRYIYAQSEGAVVVRSDLNKGGTWTGANENLKHKWSVTLCWDYPYPGNQALLERGAVSITDAWDGTIPTSAAADETWAQASLFE